MIEVFNILDSYNWYRKGLLVKRIENIVTVINIIILDKTSKREEYENKVEVSFLNVEDKRIAIKYIDNLLVEENELRKNVRSLKKDFVRLPVKRIEKLEKEYNIVPEIKDPTAVIFTSIVLGYMKFLIRKLFEGHDIRLGARLGMIGIRGKKVKARIDYKGEVKGVAPSWAKTKKLWDTDPIAKAKKQLVYCFNEHTEGIKYRIAWNKKEVIVKNKIFYGLTFNRANRRELWKLLNEGKEYLVIE